MNAKTNVRAGMVTALLLAVALLSGCGMFDCTAGSYRCANNNLQGCSNSEMFGATSWHDYQVCEPPQVCRFEVAAPGVETMGCYDQNAYCAPGLNCAPQQARSRGYGRVSCVLPIRRIDGRR